MPNSWKWYEVKHRAMYITWWHHDQESLPGIEFVQYMAKYRPRILVRAWVCTISGEILILTKNLYQGSSLYNIWTHTDQESLPWFKLVQYLETHWQFCFCHGSSLYNTWRHTDHESLPWLELVQYLAKHWSRIFARARVCTIPGDTLTKNPCHGSSLYSTWRHTDQESLPWLELVCMCDHVNTLVMSFFNLLTESCVTWIVGISQFVLTV